MRPRLVPFALLLAALAPARTAAADDDTLIRRVPQAPIAGTPIRGTMSLSSTEKAKYPGLVIAGAIASGLGAAGVVAGLLLMPGDTGGCVYERDPDSSNPAAYKPNPTCPAPRNLGVPTLSIGAAVAAAGLAMVLVGVQPADEPSSARRFVPQVAVGPTGGTLTWRF